ncbi:MAG: transcriptional regulator [Spirochaetota bacterium]
MPVKKKSGASKGGMAAPSEPVAHMDAAAFASIRSKLGRSQREIADILGLSLKAVESYEQGWRKVPANVERILWFLYFKLNEKTIEEEAPCWERTDCPEDRSANCVARLAGEGRFCWFFTGKLCDTAREKRGESCYTCDVFTKLVHTIEGA